MFNHRLIEKKWQNFWQERKVFKTESRSDKKFYVLDMFPYPSAAGLHLGHPLGYTATDIVARYKRLQGFDVLHPMGWDAFGLPAEQYALNTGNHPADFSKKNISNFKNQIQSLGFSYDWDKEIDTTDPLFYEKTQWIFRLLYKKGLAELRDTEVNWCEKLGTVLANEELVLDDKGNLISERGGFPVVAKQMKQWVLKITEYADKLLEGLEGLEFPDSLKQLQTKWIGKSTGWVVKFFLKNGVDFVEVFTTRLETIFGVSFIGLSMNHPISKKLMETNPEIAKFIQQNSNISNKMSTQIKGIFTNLFLIHPLSGQPIPTYITNYVLGNYGSGAVMGVPAHDDRDAKFGELFNLPIIEVIRDGVLINSAQFNDQDIKKARLNLFNFLSKQKLAKTTTAYKIKDWVFSRQRYWGEPFPVYFDENNKIYLEEKLVELPKLDQIQPSGTGESPLANAKEWVFFEHEGKKYRRETNTMPQWAGSSWYFLAYILKNDDGTYLDFTDSQAMERFQKWLPVDLYIGGQEHAVGHLIYSRFWHKVLFDSQLVSTSEPFFKVVNQGMLLGTDGQKMSKSKGNIINPDDVVEEFGADSLRLYLMFIGPLTEVKIWDWNGIKGMYSWVKRVYRTILNTYKFNVNIKNIQEFEKQYHSFIAETTTLVSELKFNVAISKMMTYINFLNKTKELPSQKYLIDFVIIFGIFAPHLAEELLEKLGQKDLSQQKWPSFDTSFLDSHEFNLPVAINGKTRLVLPFSINISSEEIISECQNNQKIKAFLNKLESFKPIYIPKKMINFVGKVKTE